MLIKLVMKKSSQNTTLFNKDNPANKNIKIDITKTTNVNILLNRVRLDQKKDLRKKIIFLSLLVSTISVIVVFALI